MQLMKRSVGQAIRIQPNPELDPATPVGELFVQGPVRVILTQAEAGAARFAIYADPRLLVLEDELFVTEQEFLEGAPEAS